MQTWRGSEPERQRRETTRGETETNKGVIQRERESEYMRDVERPPSRSDNISIVRIPLTSFCIISIFLTTNNQYIYLIL